jgi:hypothetical protein
MSPRQKVVLWVGVLLMAVMGVCPPWACVGAGGIRRAIGYHLLFLPPEGACFAATVDGSRLLIQWAMLLVVGAACCIAWPTPGEVRKLRETMGLVNGLAFWTGAIVTGLLYYAKSDESLQQNLRRFGYDIWAPPIYATGKALLLSSIAFVLVAATVEVLPGKIREFTAEIREKIGKR